MKNKLILALISAAVILGGCSGEKNVPEEEIIVSEQIKNNEQTSAEKDVTESLEKSEEQTAEEIKAKIDQITKSADSLYTELVKVNELFDEYEEAESNAPDQMTMNMLSQWEVKVWKEETLSILERIKTDAPADYNAILDEYKKWESYVPSMVKKISFQYEGGSIYPAVYSYNEAMRYKRMAYILASSLADIRKDQSFGFPDYTPCGYYGDYAGDSYLIIAEGMESGTYTILIHIDDTKELRGVGTVEDAPDSDTYLMFTTDDGSLKGFVNHSSLEASLYVTETDYSVIGPEGAYSFEFKY